MHVMRVKHVVSLRVLIIMWLLVINITRNVDAYNEPTRSEAAFNDANVFTCSVVMRNKIVGL